MRSTYQIEINCDKNLMNEVIQGFLIQQGFELQEKNGEQYYRAGDIMVRGYRYFNYSIHDRMVIIQAWLKGAFGEAELEQNALNVPASIYKNELETLFQEIAKINQGGENIMENQPQPNMNAIPNQVPQPQPVQYNQNVEPTLNQIPQQHQPQYNVNVETVQNGPQHPQPQYNQNQNQTYQQPQYNNDNQQQGYNPYVNNTQYQGPNQGYQQQGYNQNYQASNANQFAQNFQNANSKSQETMCEVGFWLSLVGLIISLFGVTFGAIIYILDFYFAVQGMKTRKRGKATATIVLSIISLVILGIELMAKMFLRALY